MPTLDFPKLTLLSPVTQLQPCPGLKQLLCLFVNIDIARCTAGTLFSLRYYVGFGKSGKPDWAYCLTIWKQFPASINVL